MGPLQVDSRPQIRSRCTSSLEATRTKQSDSQLTKRFKICSRWRAESKEILVRVFIKASPCHQVVAKPKEPRQLSEYRVDKTKTSRATTGGWTLQQATWTQPQIRSIRWPRAIWLNSIKRSMQPTTHRRANLINNNKYSSTWPCKRR